MARRKLPKSGLPGLQVTTATDPAFAPPWKLYQIAIAYRALLDAQGKGNKKGVKAAKSEGARRLNKNERVAVMVMLRLEGYVFTYREAGYQFDVTHPQILNDQKGVDKALVEHHRRMDRDADAPVTDLINQHKRIVREFWRLYEEEKSAPAERRHTLTAIAEEQDRHLDRLQEVGIVPRTPKKLEWDKLLFPMPVAAEFVQVMIDAAFRAGLRGEQLRVFQREAMTGLKAKKHEGELAKGLTINITPGDQGDGKSNK